MPKHAVSQTSRSKKQEPLKRSQAQIRQPVSVVQIRQIAHVRVANVLALDVQSPMSKMKVMEELAVLVEEMRASVVALLVNVIARVVRSRVSFFFLKRIIGMGSLWLRLPITFS